MESYFVLESLHPVKVSLVIPFAVQTVRLAIVVLLLHFLHELHLLSDLLLDRPLGEPRCQQYQAGSEF
jgi:hypothetical protein